EGGVPGHDPRWARQQGLRFLARGLHPPVARTHHGPAERYDPHIDDDPAAGGAADPPSSCGPVDGLSGGDGGGGHRISPWVHSICRYFAVITSVRSRMIIASAEAVP